ncbi:hypothetical protein Dthio_PD0731 [Desulfonatronospira thiodismutans ASO3-1]|uniref:PilT protein domain protein n=1 Tax=Desulfonatronospira thiodismutans ASO3-1 TaxID=555779 RepID=D6SRT4_9BACT|nr:hypothetical protein [Desulfonatronospira thiodismutans]EFI33400.1 hypothetical protein Dthio_PD0731 [Desulfonatronospira thiodismutans ASO3-1]
MKRCFIDSNIVVYANDTRAKSRQSRAIETISACMRAGKVTENMGTLCCEFTRLNIYPVKSSSI